MSNEISAIDYRALLDAQKPATLLRLIPEDAPPALGMYRAEALLDLDRTQEARQILDPLVGQLEGETFATAERLWAQVLLRQGWFDGAILAAESALEAAESDGLRAMALASAAVGFAQKRCWNLAGDRLRSALELDPTHPHVLIAQARIRLEADQRIEARKIYERMAQLKIPWAQAYARWGLSHVAYLLGEFAQARQYGEAALSFSDEMVLPLYVLAQVALAQQDAASLEGVVAALEQRSPQAEALPDLKKELEKLCDRLAVLSDPARQHEHRRLEAFPTLVQRRDYCGPSTVELVLRYWRDGSALSNDQIAEMVKFPRSGTPVYRMREFFHLVGYETMRPLAPVDKLKKLIDASYPVIIQEEFSNSSHVAVVIGYDEVHQVVELQDPMTHVVTCTPYAEFDRLRRSYLNSAVVAFPRGQGHDQALARLNLFDNQVAIWTDQAVLEMDQGRPERAAEMMRRAVKRLPAHALSWIMLLHAEMEQWRAARLQITYPPETLAARLAGKAVERPEAAAQRFQETLAQARKFHPAAEFIFQFEGSAALLVNDVEKALKAFEHAIDLDPDDARNYASLAECRFGQREYSAAQETAWKALQRDQGLVSANVWVARCLAEDQAENAQHYAAVAAELAPDWWLAHLAFSEAHYSARSYDAARREVETALSLSPGNPEVLTLRGELLSLAGDAAGAALDAQSVLDSPLPRSLHTMYKAHQLLCRLMFGAELYEEAGEQIVKLLLLTPDDPWAVQFQSAVQCEALIQSGVTLDEAALAGLRQQYEKAVELNAGETWVVSDYLRYLNEIAGMEIALEATSQACQAYPDHGNLLYLRGVYQARSGDAAAAAQTMLAALGRADGVQNRDELYQIFNYVLDGLGVEAGEQALMEAPIQEGSAPGDERRRALGLVLAQRDPAHAERARELLREALEADPEDAYAWMRLGDVAENDGEQENCYRRALMAAPDWAFARANLARFLVHLGRYAEGLEFTSGYESRSQDLLVAHGQALTGIGYYEEAAEMMERAIAAAASPQAALYYDKWFAESSCGRHEAAYQTARRAASLFPADLLWHVRIARSLRGLERIDQAWEALELGQQIGLEPAALLQEQFELTWQVHDESATWNIVQQLLQMEAEQTPPPDQLTWAEGKQLMLLVKSGQLAEARALLDRRQLSADGWGKAAWTAMLSEEYTFALELALHTLELDGKQFSGMYTRARSLMKLNQESQAVEMLHALRTAYPDDHHAYENLALFAAGAGEMDDALELADQGVLLGPYCPTAWAARGYVYFVSGQLVEALTDLQLAWTRADTVQRMQTPVFWWLLGILQDDLSLASEMRQAAQEQAQTDLDQRLIATVDALLAAGDADE